MSLIFALLDVSLLLNSGLGKILTFWITRIFATLLYIDKPASIYPEAAIYQELSFVLWNQMPHQRTQEICKILSHLYYWVVCTLLMLWSWDNWELLQSWVNNTAISCLQMHMSLASLEANALKSREKWKENAPVLKLSLWCPHGAGWNFGMEKGVQEHSYHLSMHQKNTLKAATEPALDFCH